MDFVLNLALDKCWVFSKNCKTGGKQQWQILQIFSAHLMCVPAYKMPLPQQERKMQCTRLVWPGFPVHDFFSCLLSPVQMYFSKYSMIGGSWRMTQPSFNITLWSISNLDHVCGKRDYIILNFSPFFFFWCHIFSFAVGNSDCCGPK